MTLLNNAQLRQQRRASIRRRMRAFTLFEVLLVLSIMVILASIAGIAIRGGLQQQRLVKAAEQIRLAWAQARVQAIKTGRVQVFYHAPYERHYFVTPQQSLDDPLDGLNVNATGFGNQSSMNARQNNGLDYNAIDATDIRERKLPEGVSFVGADIQSDQRSTLNLSQSVDPNLDMSNVLSFGTEEQAPEQWGMPLFFFPDGSSSVARLVLKNERGQAITVYLRGMTGMARVGEVQDETDVVLQGTF
ncbi:MAG: prepilin-type N-terminal cleavage/methylation domain-containing protein [Planctomycetales bacterium]|nr:prepilin-type N-terminal cleavage/methylation domain-containing protein [Planctomycetales bacterium]